MNTKLIISLSILIFTMSCNSRNDNNNINKKESTKIIEDNSPIVKELVLQNQNTKPEVNVYEIPTLTTLFVNKITGGNIYENSDTNSSILAKLTYGAKVEIIEDHKEWYIIKERISKNFIKNGQEITSLGWEKVYILKSDVGEIESVKLTEKQIYKTFQNDSINKFLELKLISKNEYEKINTRRNEVIKKENELVEVIDTTLAIKLNKQKTKTFVSTPSAEESSINYNYIGHIDSLEAFILSASYYEGSEFILYSSRSGDEILKFNDFPNFSLNGDIILSIYTNPYDQSSDLEIYQINKKQIDKKLEASFVNWMVAVEQQEVKWIDNSTIALKVTHSNVFWNEDGGLSNNYEYLKIKILYLTM